MKSNINKHFQQNVFLISTVEDTGRQRETMAYLNSLGIQYQLRIAPYNGRLQGALCDNFLHLWNPDHYLHAGAESLRLCYASIFAECIYNNIDQILIMEDDIVFEPDFEDKFDKFMCHVPNNWDILNLGHHESKDQNAWVYTQFNEHVQLAEAVYATHCVAIQGTNNMREMVNKIMSCLMPIDFVFTYFSHALKCYNEPFWKYYIPSEIICRQRSYRSDKERQPFQTYKSLINPS